MTLEIAQLGQPVLRTAAIEVAPDRIAHPQLQEFLTMMTETLAEAKAAGLAAPQVFVSLRIFVAAILPPESEDAPPGVEICINPKITPLTDEQTSEWEGCLSFPELLVLVPRLEAVKIEYLNVNGALHTRELEGFAARVAQHELDHLDGILTLDRAASTRDIIKASELEAVQDPEDS